MTRLATQTGNPLSILGLAFLTAFAAPMSATAQTAPVTTTPPGKPDACGLVRKSDLETLFPGRPVESKGATLSLVFKGPQYNQGCQYLVRLPSPTSRSDLAKFVTVTVVLSGEGTSGRGGSIDVFKNVLSTRTKIAESDPNKKRTVEPARGIGDEAFQEVSEFTTDVRVRKGDLVFVISLDNYSTQTLPNALALAEQAAGRWQEGTGMVAGTDTAVKSPVAPKDEVIIPPDTRKSAQAPVDRWPDACGLLMEEDVRAVFGDMKLDPVRKVMGTLTSDGREQKVEKLPNPIACHYTASKALTEGGARKIISNTISLNVQDVAATPELALKYYQISKKVGDAKTDLQGIGDEASLSPTNQIVIRKGVVNIAVRVGGDMRDKALYDDATQRVNAIAKRVAAHMP
ncbi:hypothetical protein [Methylobacterium brachythecii]|uniref:Secreted protein n=1 Tax=Methylobacterium brachythecii TaxID=1176177 RepID=A0A7W6AGG8_9HYPH|nr:hypothetical protein [Methylobacterium brachythecii]MBB3902892.1 hypothetical protein [Methylobacterium brachythecii]GLS43819.1 hypothetical protein GCM10007884_18040 [Methylobacterium brachythecii]